MTLKSWVFGVGLTAAILGMALEQRWLVWVAAGLLVVAFLLRFFTQPPEIDRS